MSLFYYALISKYRKALLDKEIDKIIEETAAKKEIGIRS